MKEKFPATVCTMEKALEQVFDEEVEERNNGIETVDTEDFMYIVYNKMCFHGASYMFDQDFMGSLAEKFKDDLIILLSSVHEIIFMKRQNIEKMEELIDMVRKVNDVRFCRKMYFQTIYTSMIGMCRRHAYSGQGRISRESECFSLEFIPVNLRNTNRKCSMPLGK